jgi:hypothetical protein
MFKVVYGKIGPAISVAENLTQQEAEEYAAKMNKQAPQYDHRVVPQTGVSTNQRRKPRL